MGLKFRKDYRIQHTNSNQKKAGEKADFKAKNMTRHQGDFIHIKGSQEDILFLNTHVANNKALKCMKKRTDEIEL